MINSFDDITKVLNKKNLIVIGGRPGIGKTTFAINLASNVCNKGFNAAYFCLELSYENFIKSALCRISRVAIKNIINEKIENFSGSQLYVSDKPDLTITDFTNKCKNLKDNNGLAIAIVDYLQLLSFEKNDSLDGKDRIDYILKTMKNIAEELNITIIVISQLHRRTETNDEPQLLDFSNFSSVEQYADVVMLIKRNTSKSLDNKIVDIVVAKNKNGETGTISLIFDKTNLSFSQL